MSEAQSVKPSYNDVNTTTLAVVAVVGALLLLVIVLFTQAYYNHFAQVELDQKYQTPEQLRELRARQRGQLNAYRWVDQSKKIVAIPIDQAIELTAQELAAHQTVAHAGEVLPRE